MPFCILNSLSALVGTMYLLENKYNKSIQRIYNTFEKTPLLSSLLSLSLYSPLLSVILVLFIPADDVLCKWFFSFNRRTFYDCSYFSMDSKSLLMVSLWGWKWWVELQKPCWRSVPMHFMNVRSWLTMDLSFWIKIIILFTLVSLSCCYSTGKIRVTRMIAIAPIFQNWCPQILIKWKWWIRKLIRQLSRGWWWTGQCVGFVV